MNSDIDTWPVRRTGLFENSADAPLGAAKRYQP